jgi:thioredoxin-related protein
MWMYLRGLTALFGFLAFASAAFADDDYKGPIETEDGMYTESWFLQSFMDLSEDLAEAKAQGKRFVIMWELKGCPYCKETHFVNFANEEIRHFVRGNFLVLQLNIQGSRAVTDFDGEELEERGLARKYGIRYTPTFQFFGEDAEAMPGLEPREREVTRMFNLFKPELFLATFRYVQERAYETEKLRSYLKRQLKDS